jgi:hypothetical protein
MGDFYSEILPFEINEYDNDLEALLASQGRRPLVVTDHGEHHGQLVKQIKVCSMFLADHMP